MSSKKVILIFSKTKFKINNQTLLNKKIKNSFIKEEKKVSHIAYKNRVKEESFRS